MARFSLSAVESFVAASHQSEPIWIGVEVHKRSYHVARDDQAGLLPLMLKTNSSIYKKQNGLSVRGGPFLYCTN